MPLPKPRRIRLSTTRRWRACGGALPPPKTWSAGARKMLPNRRSRSRQAYRDWKTRFAPLIAEIDTRIDRVMNSSGAFSAGGAGEAQSGLAETRRCPLRGRLASATAGRGEARMRAVTRLLHHLVELRSGNALRAGTGADTRTAARQATGEKAVVLRTAGYSPRFDISTIAVIPYGAMNTTRSHRRAGRAGPRASTGDLSPAGRNAAQRDCRPGPLGSGWGWSRRHLPFICRRYNVRTSSVRCAPAVSSSTARTTQR